MTAPSSKPYFRSMRPKADPRQMTLTDLPRQDKPADARDPLDYDPTPAYAPLSFLRTERQFILAHGLTIWEGAAGSGDMAQVMLAEGFYVHATDIVDRGWPLAELRDFFSHTVPPAPIHITNPPYCQISARDGHGRWLRHALTLGLPYIALLLNSDWAAARVNGHDALFQEHPPSIEYRCCFKIDFRGGGSPPQRNSWFVWDVNRPAATPNQWPCARLYKEAPDPTQETLL